VDFEHGSIHLFGIVTSLSNCCILYFISKSLDASTNGVDKFLPSTYHQ
jgi:hypothetical protein